MYPIVIQYNGKNLLLLPTTTTIFAGGDDNYVSLHRSINSIDINVHIYISIIL